MKEDEAKIGLTSEQARELFELSHNYMGQMGFDVSNPEVWFAQHLGNYLSMLALDAEIENSGHSVKKSVGLRRETMTAFESYLGHPPTADDLLNPLSQATGKIDDAIADAVRRDIKRLRA